MVVMLNVNKIGMKPSRKKQKDFFKKGEDIDNHG